MSREDRSDGEFECPVCGEAFDSEEERDEHLVRSHRTDRSQRRQQGRGGPVAVDTTTVRPRSTVPTSRHEQRGGTNKTDTR